MLVRQPERGVSSMTAVVDASVVGDVAVKLLHTAYPCCGKRSRFPTVAGRYLRRCRICGVRWRVLRSSPPPSTFARSLGVRIDVLTWERRG